MKKTKKDSSHKGERIQPDNDIKNIKRQMFSGTYGCVYHPAVGCKNPKSINSLLTDPKKLVTKYVSRKEVKDELLIMNTLRKIPNYKKWFTIYNDRVCEELDIDEKDLKKCHTVEASDKIGIYMEYGGVSLSDYPIKHVDKLFHHLLKGMLLMHSKNVCHMDIKRPNILFNSNHPTYIDFGLSIQNITEMHSFTESYMVWPPDYNAYIYVSNYGENATRFSKLSRVEKYTYTYQQYINLVSLAKKMLEKDKENNTMYYPKSIDIFSLGRMINVYIEEQNLPGYVPMKNIIKRMMIDDPTKRITDGELHEYLSTIEKIQESQACVIC
jgi:serine/threonine protein kinase